MHERTLLEQTQALQAGEVSSVELTRSYLERIKEHDGSINSFITVTEEQALAQAKQADRARASGKAGPLTGAPLAHKDIFCTRGVKTSCGSRMLDNFISPYDATVVERLEAAGMVMLGKTNMVRPTKPATMARCATLGIRSGSRVVPAVAQPLPWRRAWPRRPPQPTPAVPFGSQPHSAA